MLKKIEKVRRVTTIENPWWTYVQDEIILPSGKHGEYHYASLKGASVIVPVHDDGTFGLVRQYRYPTQTESLEFPMGGCQGKTFEETARQELIEEVGMTGELEEIGTFQAANGFSDEVAKIYLARRLREDTSRDHDDEEEFEQVRMSATEIDEAIMNGEIVDGYTITAWFFTKQKLKI